MITFLSQTVAKSISDINLTRQRLVQFLQRNENDHIQALEFFTNYYKSLLILEQHFPFGKESQSSILGIKTGKVPTVKVTKGKLLIHPRTHHVTETSLNTYTSYDIIILYHSDVIISSHMIS